jgi:hypothetical protein
MDIEASLPEQGILDLVGPAATLSIEAVDGHATDDLLFPQAQTLLDCLCAAVQENSSIVFPAPEICCLRAGDAVLLDITNEGVDECCRGLAYVRIDSFYPTGAQNAPFPSPSSDFGLDKCSPYAWGLSMEIGIYRCIGEADCDRWTYVAERQMLDAKSMREALCCFMAPLDPQTVSVTPWQSKGPDGGCIGGTMGITVMVTNCGEC